MATDKAWKLKKLCDRMMGRGVHEVSAEEGSTLTAVLEGDVCAWLASVRNYFTNERHLQVELAIFLEKTGHYARVYTEYRVPLDEIYARRPEWKPQDINDKSIAFPWPNQISLDIVVLGYNGHYVSVELKYATRCLSGAETLFGEPMLTNSPILKNQAASDLVMYNYWKDVRRLEAMAEIYDKVEGGIALIVSNSRDLWELRRSGVLYAPFSTHDGRVFEAGVHRWPDAVSASVRSAHPDFTTAGSYVCVWHDTAIEYTAKNGDRFRSMIIKVEKHK